MTKRRAGDDRLTFLAGGGEMGALIRGHDWSKTAIGPIESWSPALRMQVGFLLANRFPVLLWWGPTFCSIYNDAYAPILGAILVVDDNADSAAALAMLLTITGHETQTAHDGLEAVAAAERFRPEVVLLDIGLPKLSGLDVARRIREQPWGRDMVLVAVSGWGQEEDRRKSREAGFDVHMVKPVNLDALMKRLAAVAAERSPG